jgi:hypothetical protein
LLPGGAFGYNPGRSFDISNDGKKLMETGNVKGSDTLMADQGYHTIELKRGE